MMPQSTVTTTSSYSLETYSSNGNLWGATESDLNAEVIEEEDATSELGKDEFMKLLLAQMQNQDPLNPTDNTEFVAQLAQFTSLEQMTNMNTSLEEMLESNATISESINSTMLINYIGKNVDAVSNYFNFDGNDPVELTFYAGSDIVEGTLDIYNASDTLVRSIDLAGVDSGVNTIEWDGLSTYGTLQEEGGYYYDMTAYDILDESVSVTPKLTGVVDGVTYLEGEAHLKIGDILVPFHSVSNITQPDEETVEE